MRVHAHPGTGLIGLATTKKIGSRPRRNYARRRVVASLQEESAVLVSGLDYVIVVFETSIRAPYEELRQELVRLIKEVSAKWVEGSESF